MPMFIEKRKEVMSGRKNLQHLKALERAPQGTLAFRFYLPIRYRTILYNKAFDGFAVNRLRIAEILSAAGREEEYQDRRKIMKASVSWNKNVTNGTTSILRIEIYGKMP